MSARRFLYFIPAAVSTATSVLAVFCMVEGLQEVQRPFCGFFFHANLTVAALQRKGWVGNTQGLLPGDVVVKFQGKKPRDGRELAQWVGALKVGKQVEFHLFRPGTGSTRKIVTKLRHLTTADILATFVLPYSIGVLYLLLGVVVFFLKRSYEAALLLSICVVASVFYMTTLDAHTAFHFSRLWIAYPLFGAVSIHLFSAFPARRPNFHRFSILAIPYSIATLLLTFTQVNLYVHGFARISSSLSASYLATCFLLDIFLLTLSMTKEPSAEVRNKAKMILIGLLLTIAASVVWNVFVRFNPTFITAERAMMLSSLCPILLAYAVIKKNLFDMDLVLRTTTTYVTATILVVALYFIVVFMIGMAMSPWTQRYVGFQQSMAAAVASTLIVAILFHPLRMRIQQVVDRFFFREKGLLEKSLVQVAHDLDAHSLKISELADRLTKQVKDLMHCRFVVLLCPVPPSQDLQMYAAAGEIDPHLASVSIPAFDQFAQNLFNKSAPIDNLEPYTPENSKEISVMLKTTGVSLIMPLKRASSPTGLLLLGPRPHGDAFTRFDIKLLSTLAPTAALVLENALLLHEHAERERLATLGKFSAVIIHEIKNPLGIIKVSSGTLRKRFSKEDSGFELSSFIEEEVDRMNNTIARFLAFARPHPPRPKPFDIAALIQRIVSVAEGELNEAKVRLVIEDLSEPIFVMADAEQIQQAALNLIVNAKQALEGRTDGQIKISLIRHTKASPPTVEIIFADNGPGVAHENKERIFEPFFTTRRGGTGLGLAIVRQMLSEQGGRIRVRPLGIGTEFIISLPLHQPEP